MYGFFSRLKSYKLALNSIIPQRKNLRNVSVGTEVYGLAMVRFFAAAVSSGRHKGAVAKLALNISGKKRGNVDENLKKYLAKVVVVVLQ